MEHHMAPVYELEIAGFPKGFTLAVNQDQSLLTTMLINGIFDVCTKWTLQIETLIVGRGSGGTQIWFGQKCTAWALKPIPIFKGHFGSKRYPF